MDFVEILITDIPDCPPETHVPPGIFDAELTRELPVTPAAVIAATAASLEITSNPAQLRPVAEAAAIVDVIITLSAVFAICM